MVVRAANRALLSPIHTNACQLTFDVKFPPVLHKYDPMHITTTDVTTKRLRHFGPLQTLKPQKRKQRTPRPEFTSRANMGSLALSPSDVGMSLQVTAVNRQYRATVLIAENNSVSWRLNSDIGFAIPTNRQQMPDTKLIQQMISQAVWRCSSSKA
jgi:hypothetical protein